MVAALGGPADLLDNPGRHLPTPPVIVAVHAETPGFVQAIATRDVGLAVIALGGGRRLPQDAIDHAVGLTELAEIGAWVDAARPLALVHARSSGDAKTAAAALRRAYQIGDDAPRAPNLIHGRIGAAP
jgi:thymidine phosphorylase